MFLIDGSQKSGSGTIVRTSVALATLLGQEVKLINIRAKRNNPGLRAQHLEAVKACALLSGGEVKGAVVGSTEIQYKPGDLIKGGHYDIDIGTAGSTTMLASSLLPLGCFAAKPINLRLIGGLFQDFAPSAYHMKEVLLPILKKMGVEAEMRIEKPGYVPTGGGILNISIKPIKSLKPIKQLEQGKIQKIFGIALSSHLEERKVSERMAKECIKAFKARGLTSQIEVINDVTANQPGAAMAVWTQTSGGCIMGMDRAGEIKRKAEDIGKYVAENLIEDVISGATVDRFLADQLILYCALAEGESEYLIPKMTEHIESLIWLTEIMLGAKVELNGNCLRIFGIGFRR